MGNEQLHVSMYENHCVAAQKIWFWNQQSSELRNYLATMIHLISWSSYNSFAFMRVYHGKPHFRVAYSQWNSGWLRTTVFTLTFNLTICRPIIESQSSDTWTHLMAEAKQFTQADTYYMVHSLGPIGPVVNMSVYQSFACSCSNS